MALRVKKLIQSNFNSLCGNHAPKAGAAKQSVTVTEVTDNAFGENVKLHFGSGTIKFKDADKLDLHKASVKALGQTYLGTFDLGPIDQAKDSVSWVFKVADSAIDHLQAGQTLVQKYKVAISDNHGGVTYQVVTVKIIGTNDAPVITSPPQATTVTELTNADSGENYVTHSRAGAVTFTDVDLLDTHTATFIPQGSGYLGTFVISPVNQAADSIGWTFTVPDSVLETLQVGQTLIQKYTVTVNDGHGGTAQQTVTVLIVGTNDDPTGPHEIGFNKPAVEGANEIVAESNLADGSAPAALALTQNGSFQIFASQGVKDLVIGGTTVVSNGVIAPFAPIVTAFGTLTITNINLGTGDVSYSYTLSNNTLNHQFVGNDTINVVIALLLTDLNNHAANASLTVGIIDDVPQAANDLDTAQAGATVAGNVITDAENNGDNGRDTAGADGIAGIAWANVSNNTIAGLHGTLTVGADGHYSYQANPSTASGLDTFSYTITDGDGDTATATLTISVTNGEPAPFPVVNAVDEAALDNGSNFATTAETVSGTLNLGDPDLPHVTSISGVTSSNVGASPVTVHGLYGDLQIDADGHYTYTLTAPYTTAPAANNGVTTEPARDVFTFVVTDSFGNTGSSTISISIKDDVPLAAIALKAGAALLVDESLGSNTGETEDANAGILGQVTLTAAALFNDTSVFGADGPGAKLFALNAALINTAINVIDTLTQQAVELHQTSPTLVTATAGTTGPAVFTVAINPVTGAVTLTQLRAVVHANPADPDEASSPVTLDNNLISVSLTVVDHDGDVSQTSAFLNGVIKFEDDSPALEVVPSAYGSVSLDESATESLSPSLLVAGIGDDPDVAGSGAIAAATGTGPVIETSVLFGSDGPAQSGATSYALNVTHSQSGVVVTDGSAIVLGLEGGLVVGRVTGGDFDGKAAFAISIAASTGEISVEQYLSLGHPDDSNPDDIVGLLAGTLGVTVKVTDGDGDSVSASADISAQIAFYDDGPWLGEFTDGTLCNENGTASGFFDLAPGADGFDYFTITAPKLCGVTYTTTALTDGTRLLAEAADGRDLFALNVHKDGTYTFDLLAPHATTAHDIDMHGEHETNEDCTYEEYSDDGSSFEMTSLDPEHHFGQSSGHIAHYSDDFEIEFHSGHESGDTDEDTDHECVDHISFAAHGSGSVTWTSHDIENGTSDSGTAEIEDGHLIIDPGHSFNQIEIHWQSGSFELDEMSTCKNLLPDALNLAFNITLTDGDGDQTATQILNIHEVACYSYGGPQTLPANDFVL